MCSRCSCANVPKELVPLVAIVTGNSNSGSSCIKELFERYDGKLRVRGVFRTEEKAQPFRTKYSKLEVVTGVDANKPETLKKAFENADYALIVTPHDPASGIENDANLNETLINHAVENGVKYIVWVGSFTVKDPVRMSMISRRFVSSEKLLEKLGKEKGLKWTVLRGGYFMENWLNPHIKDSIKTKSSVNFPKIYVATVDTRDIGRSAAACLAASNIEQHNGKKYEMNGPEILSTEDVVKAFSKVLGKELTYNDAPTREMLKSTLPPPIAEIIEYFLDEGKSATPFTQDVKNLTGHNITFEQFLNDHKDFFN